MTTTPEKPKTLKGRVVEIREDNTIIVAREDGAMFPVGKTDFDVSLGTNVEISYTKEDASEAPVNGSISKV